MATRISIRQLEELQRGVTAIDLAILRSLKTCRYLTGRQIVRLYFSDRGRITTATLSASYRCLNRLREYGLIRALKRRIGGVRAGSGSYTWVLTSAGFRLLNLDNVNDSPRKQFREPTPHFLEHTLLVSETWLLLIEICARRKMNLVDVQFEPDCWRNYTKGGKHVVLKPDLFALTKGDTYEDYWFIEIDCNTETIARVIDKCGRYIQYFHSGTEQKRSGVFPYVVWIVPNTKRKDSLNLHIGKHYPKAQDIFVTILPDELEALMTSGAEKFKKNYESRTMNNENERSSAK